MTKQDTVIVKETLPASEKVLRSLFRVMLLSRAVDDEELRLKKQNKAYFCIGSAGHEAIGAALSHYLSPTSDWFYPYYRDRALCLGLGMTVEEQLLGTVGSSDDPNSGARQMPSHWGHRGLHIISQSSPTGTQFNQAVGCAEAGRYIAGRGLKLPVGEKEVVYTSSGEGATSEGEFWEAINVAANRKLPVFFVVQDNEYAISVPREVTTAGGDVGRCFQSVPGLEVIQCDGTTLMDSLKAVEKAVAHLRAGKGPVLLRAIVTRPYSHSNSDDHVAYRTRDEIAEELSRDCLPITAQALIKEGVLDEEGIEELKREVAEEARAAAKKALAAKKWRPEEVMDHLYGPEDPSIFNTQLQEAVSGDKGDLVTLASAINTSIAQAMEGDERIVVFGQDVADASRDDALESCKGKGGVFKLTAGLQRKYGSDRVFNTLLSENSIIGRAVGMATRGLRPIPEIQFVDFLWYGYQQVRSEMATMRYRSAGHWSAPVILRTPVGGYLRGGAIYHSQSPESVFLACPGIKVAYPSNAADAMGLMRAALRMEDPVLFLEPKHLYYQGYARTHDPGPDHIVPFGVAALRREGTDATVVTWGTMVQKSLDAAEKLSKNRGYEVDVLDLRSLRPVDMEAIQSSVRKTGRLIVIHEEMRTGGFGAEIAAAITEECFEWLDAPVKRIGAKDVWVSYAPVLEEAALPHPKQIEQELEALISY